MTDKDGMILLRYLWASDYGALRQALDAAVGVNGIIPRLIGSESDVVDR